jgi:hypothetical protein
MIPVLTQSNSFVTVILFLFVPPGGWPHKWPKHAGGYLGIKIYQNIIEQLLALMFIGLMHEI